MRKHAHITHRSQRRYLLSPLERWIIHLALPALIIVAAAFIVGTYAHREFREISLLQFTFALMLSMLRITLAYLIVLVVGVCLGLLSVATPTLERILLPVWDVLESLPVLVFFPAIIAAFAAFGGFFAAAICIMALSMLWNIVFSTIGGLRVIPEEVRSLGPVFGLTKWEQLRHIILPALIPSLVTGSLLAWAEGWNMLMIAEVIHTYVPKSTDANDLFGIGSILVHASANGDTHAFIVAVGVIVAVVAIMNLLVWQPLLNFGEKFRFE